MTPDKRPVSNSLVKRLIVLKEYKRYEISSHNVGRV